MDSTLLHCTISFMRGKGQKGHVFAEMAFKKLCFFFTWKRLECVSQIEKDERKIKIWRYTMPSYTWTTLSRWSTQTHVHSSRSATDNAIKSVYHVNCPCLAVLKLNQLCSQITSLMTGRQYQLHDIIILLFTFFPLSEVIQRWRCPVKI